MPTTSTLSAEQRTALLAAKLKALVVDATGADAAGLVVGTVPGGATVVDGPRGWVYVEDDSSTGLGAALAWARRRAVEVAVVADDRAGVLARRAQLFRRPPEVFVVEGTRLGRAEATPAPPFPDGWPAGTETLVTLLEAAGVDVVLDGSEVVGEVLGLEVARVVEDDDGEHRLDVGVGRYDREVVGMLHGGMAASESMATVVGIVRERRSAAAEPHPLNRLVPERWLRARLAADPAALGLAHVGPLPALAGRRGLRETEPAMALGRTSGGEPVVLACSVGIDLELVPAAAEVHRWWSEGAGVDPETVALRLVVPERDDHPVTRELASALVVPAEVVTVPRSWRA